MSPLALTALFVASLAPTSTQAIGVVYEVNRDHIVRYCPITETEETVNISRSRNYYECPGQLSAEYSECCDNNRCCTVSIYKQLDQRLSYIVIAACFLFSVLILALFCLCSLCKCCPLFNICHNKLPNDYAREQGKLFDIPPYQRSIMKSSDDSVPVIQLNDSLLDMDCGVKRPNRLVVSPLTSQTLTNGTVVKLTNSFVSIQEEMV